MENKIKAGIVGGTGYTGGELIRLLLNHPYAELAFALSRNAAGKRFIVFIRIFWVKQKWNSLRSYRLQIYFSCACRIKRASLGWRRMKFSGNKDY
jgi:N-acetyl-gamma-glutamylphosphate reductase